MRRLSTDRFAAAFRRTGGSLAVALIATTGWAVHAEPSGAARTPNVRDSIEYADFVAASQTAATGGVAPLSPDGRTFAAVTMRGDLKSDRRVAQFWLFDAAGNAQPKRTAAASFASGSNHDPVSQWRWSSDSRSILFLGADDDGIQRLYRLDIASGAIRPISQPDVDVARFDERDGSIVFLAHRPIRSDALYQASPADLPDAVSATGQGILSLLFPRWYESYFQQGGDQLWRVGAKGPEAVMRSGSRDPIVLKDSRIALAPDGRRLLITQPVPDIPKSWERYASPLKLPGMQIVADTPATLRDTRNRLQQYAMIDLATGTRSVLLDAPIAIVARLTPATPQWSADSRYLALPYFYPSVAKAAGTDGVMPCTVMIVSPGEADGVCPTVIDASVDIGGADDLRLTALEWLPGGDRLLARFTPRTAPDKPVTIVYARGADGWTGRRFVAQTAPTAHAFVREDLDQRPVLMARGGDGADRVLLDPNPQLDAIAMGSVGLYRWKDADGNPWTGVLVKPADFVPGRRYPLVIQTHNVQFGKYLLDGPSATGFAARAIAARGMLVLQVDEIRKDFGTQKESATGAAGYRAAIAQLAADGLVDDRKVGIIAWSHMGPYVMKALVDEPNAYAAATFAEASYNSYGEYLSNVDYLGPERLENFRAQAGAAPFGPGLAKWVADAPGFQTDRVCTPILRQINSPIGLVYGWDGYAALRAQNKPVDLLYLRRGAHVLVKPGERLVEQGMNVDWFDYWLNGHRDPDPAKAAQYKRWDGLASLRTCARSE